MSDNSNKSNEILSISKAAKIIGVSDQTLRRWAEEGLIECLYTPSGQRKFRKAAIENIMTRTVPTMDGSKCPHLGFIATPSEETGGVGIEECQCPLCGGYQGIRYYCYTCKKVIALSPCDECNEKKNEPPEKFNLEKPKDLDLDKKRKEHPFENLTKEKAEKLSKEG